MSIESNGAIAEMPFPLLAVQYGWIERDEIGLRKIMHYIDPGTIHQWVKSSHGNMLRPESCGSICADCHKPTALKIDKDTYTPQTNSLSCSAHCTMCGAKAKVWIIAPSTRSACREIWTLPVPKSNWILSIEEESLSFKLHDAYKAAVDAYNIGMWRSVVTECGRALEGITQEQFPSKEDRKTLKKLSEGNFPKDLPSPLFEPIIELTKAVRLGRLTGAHFDLKCPADNQIAREVLELTEYCLKYFYVLPKQSSELKAKIEEMTDKVRLDEEE